MTHTFNIYVSLTCVVQTDAKFCVKEYKKIDHLSEINKFAFILKRSTLKIVVSKSRLQKL